MRNRLISTVGTSLFSNIRGEYRDTNGILQNTHQELQQLLRDQNWGQLAQVLSRIPSSARICGAEINSIYEVVKRQKLNLEHIHFFVSDTEEGRRTGEVLETYIIECGLEGLRTTTTHIIEELQDQNPSRFKVYGLRNLVRELGKLVNQYSADTLIIDATGGYKAQIAIAVVFGQALSIPVLYRHERFSEIIDFPPMPITFDYDLLGKNAALLAAFERGDVLTRAEIDTLDEKVRVLLEEIEVDGENVFALGAVGQIFLTGFRLRFPASRKLDRIPDEARKPPSFRDDHYPKGFREFVNKVWEEFRWIKTAHTIPYDKQRAIKGIGFYVREDKLIGTYQDGSNFGARFEILTNATDKDQLTWAADQLNQHYGSSKT